MLGFLDFLGDKHEGMGTSPSEAETASCYPPSCCSGGLKPVLPSMDVPPAANGSATTSLHAFLEIINRSARASDLEVQERPTRSVTSSLLVGRFTAQNASQQDPFWPCFLAGSTILLGSASNPMKLKAPVMSYAAVPKVWGLTDQGFPTLPPLESSLSAEFGFRAMKHVGRRLTPPSSGDQLTEKLTDKIYQCSSQVGAAMNNVTILMLNISRDARMPSPSPSKPDHISTAADTITNMFQSVLN